MLAVIRSVNTQPAKIEHEKKITVMPKTESPVKQNYYVPEISLSTKLLSQDLTKSLAMTILALILQFSLAIYLSQGGWQNVSSMLNKLISVY